MFRKIIEQTVSLTYICKVLLICGISISVLAIKVDSQVVDDPETLISSQFVEYLRETFGNSSLPLVTIVERIKADIPLLFGNKHISTGHEFKSQREPEVANDSASTLLFKCESNGKKQQRLNFTCLNDFCLSSEDLLALHDIPANQSVSPSLIMELIPSIVYSWQSPACHSQQSVTKGEHHSRSHTHAVWGFSFVCVTLINLCSLLGLVFIPLMKKSYYQTLLMYMVALAVGTLAGSSLLFLIPGAFGFDEEANPYRHTYVWKLTVVMGGIYMFFLVERILQILTGHTHADGADGEGQDTNHLRAPTPHNRQRTTSGCSVRSEEEPLSSIKFHTVTRVEESMNMSFKVPAVITENRDEIPQDVTVTSNLDLLSGSGDANVRINVPNGSVASATSQPPVVVAIRSVAWMIICGDGIHNFIDGLSIGAAFAQSNLAGVSVSVAVICEELPHELGDFAILLDAGMTVRQALAYNFLSACACYVGTAIGILVGELENGSSWIFAIAAGMFLYIALVDMLPEVNHAAEEGAKSTRDKWRVFLLQNLGLLTGFGIMLFLRHYAEKIDFESLG